VRAYDIFEYVDPPLRRGGYQVEGEEEREEEEEEEEEGRAKMVSDTYFFFSAKGAPSSQNPAAWLENPQFLLYAREKTSCVIVLSQVLTGSN